MSRSDIWFVVVLAGLTIGGFYYFVRHHKVPTYTIILPNGTKYDHCISLGGGYGGTCRFQTKYGTELTVIEFERIEDAWPMAR